MEKDSGTIQRLEEEKTELERRLQSYTNEVVVKREREDNIFNIAVAEKKKLN